MHVDGQPGLAICERRKDLTPTALAAAWEAGGRQCRQAFAPGRRDVKVLEWTAADEHREGMAHQPQEPAIVLLMSGVH